MTNNLTLHLRMLLVQIFWQPFGNISLLKLNMTYSLAYGCTPKYISQRNADIRSPKDTHLRINELHARHRSVPHHPEQSAARECQTHGASPPEEIRRVALCGKE